MKTEISYQSIRWSVNFDGLLTQKLSSHCLSISWSVNSTSEDLRPIVCPFDGLLTQKRGLPSDFQILDGLLICQSEGLALDFEDRFPM